MFQRCLLQKHLPQILFHRWEAVNPSRRIQKCTSVLKIDLNEDDDGDGCGDGLDDKVGEDDDDDDDSGDVTKIFICR